MKITKKRIDIGEEVYIEYDTYIIIGKITDYYNEVPDEYSYNFGYMIERYSRYVKNGDKLVREYHSDSVYGRSYAYKKIGILTDDIKRDLFIDLI